MSQKLKSSRKPVKPKKPLPAKETPAKVLVPCGLKEERVKEKVTKRKGRITTILLAQNRFNP